MSRNRIFKSVLVVLLSGMIVIQFFQPAKNSGAIEANHLFNQGQVPQEISSILQKACLDCHSNQTQYLWYHNIAPVSWIVNSHVTEGKGELNLSDWGNMDILDQIGALEDIGKEVKKGKMPLKSYQLMHPKARLSEEEADALVRWSESYSEQLLTGN